MRNGLAAPSIIVAIVMAFLMGHGCGRRSGYDDGAREALAVADSAVKTLGELGDALSAERALNEALARKEQAYIDTITALRREHSARVYPRKRAQLDSLTSHLTATPDDVRAWLKQ